MERAFEEVPLLALDGDGHVVLCTAEAARLTGYAPGEIVGEHVSKLYSEDQIEAGLPAADLRRAAESGEHARDAWVRRSDGTPFWARTVVRARRDREGGQITSFVMLIVDLSDRAAAEAALREREARARELADSMPFPIQFIDRGLRYVFANAAAAEWIGRSPEEIQGLTLAEIVEQLDTGSTLEAAMPHLFSALAGRACEFPGRARRADGAIRDIEVRLIPSTGADGSVVGVYAVVLDRTAEIRGEGARRLLRTAGELLGAPHEAALAIESTVVLAVTTFADECSAFRPWEEGVRRYAAKHGEPMSGPADVAWSDVPPRVTDVMRKGVTVAYVDLDDRSTRVVVPAPCSEGQPCALSFRWKAPFEVGAAEIEIAEDLAGRLAEALDRVELFAQATEAIRARDWLLHKVTHDLGTPIASIVMASDRMLRSAPTPDRRQRSRRFLDGIARQAEEMTLILDELLDASALRTGRRTVEPRPVDPGSIVTDAIALVDLIARAHGVELLADVGAGVPAVVADPDHIRRALSALISDAVGWSASGDTVRVEVSRADGSVVFGVTGPGPEIPAEELARLLGEEPGEGGARSPAGRVSLSLLVADSIVRAHGGALEPISALEGATRYVFSLPAVDRTEA